MKGAGRVVGVLVALYLATGCASSDANPSAPVAVLASSQLAQREFRAIHARWVRAPGERAALEGALLRFAKRHAADPLARRAQVYLAWVYIESGRLQRGRALAHRARTGPRGSVHDFASVAVAAALIGDERPAEALALLRPLRGKIIDRQERLLFGEQLVRAALSARAYTEAIEAMAEWLRDSSGEDREFVRGLAREFLLRVPPEVLERSLDEHEARLERADDELEPTLRWLSKELRERLTQIALERRDAALAARLLGGQRRRTVKREGELRALERGRTPAPQVDGRAIGVVLSLADARSRRRSIEVVTGVSRSLKLAELGQKPGRARLLTRVERGGKGEMAAALASLSGAGAAILVAGVDARGAAHAARYAKRTGVAVMLLAAPRKGSAGALVLGVSETEARNRLLAALSKDPGETVRVGPGAVPCDSRSRTPGRGRFPVAKWNAEGVAQILLDGDAPCARDVLAEVKRTGWRPRIGLGLEASHAWRSAWQPFVLSTGVLGPPASRKHGIARWIKISGGPPTWFEALGHDAAVLSSSALAVLPLDRQTQEQAEVERLQALARAELLRSNARLWTSEESGFRGRSHLGRRLRVRRPRGTK